MHLSLFPSFHDALVWTQDHTANAIIALGRVPPSQTSTCNQSLYPSPPIARLRCYQMPSRIRANPAVITTYDAPTSRVDETRLGRPSASCGGYVSSPRRGFSARRLFSTLSNPVLARRPVMGIMRFRSLRWMPQMATPNQAWTRAYQLQLHGQMLGV